MTETYTRVWRKSTGAEVAPLPRNLVRFNPDLTTEGTSLTDSPTPEGPAADTSDNNNLSEVTLLKGDY